ncbi:endonuclease/exonuclease/phosphatase family protein [Luteolibacter arcticus]|uniref:Endonuclease/exonuclease/phosphatase family protein n=1 Tax=Luteolibacter arcticus TaxID=1581411 RepID=A0ABT3GMI2_9BACT|nr:endonuclease/exonuclease/phosphatase family protein [Luteolibacter arcticus]MCW1924718.1 endonuclease/exonuclease/phosphatase family protein [Luteolibacter arcticus]
MKFHERLFQIAPGLLGAFFFSLVGCEKKDQAGDWAAQAPPPPAEAPAKPAPKPVAPARVAKSADTPFTDVAAIEQGTVRFVVFNVENWLTMDSYVDGQSQQGRPKPEKERLAVAKVLAGQKPDILGVSEIGTEEDVKDLQGYLERAGHPMAHFYLTGGADPVRSLAILSRFPIGATALHENLTYRSMKREYDMQRGILDASIATPSGTYRFLGVHLKSKRDSQDGDQEEMRLNEAHLFRREIDAVFRDDPKARLVVYGDFNDTRNSPAVKAIRGAGNSPRSLQMIALKDSRGEYWTHYWDYQDLYSRIDYVMVSDALRRSVEWDRCKIVDDPEVATASDHRPLLVILK